MFPARIAFLSLLALSSPTHAAASPTIPTDADLQQMFERGDYRACLQQTARVLQFKGEAARPYDPFVLHMRRGECLLRLNDGATALTAFTAALNAANSGAKAEIARANIVVIKASRALNFTPAAGGTAINIVQPDARKRAMALLCTDLLRISRNEYNNAMSAQGIGPILEFFPKMQELHALEMVGTGMDPQTQPMLLEMGERARTLLGIEIRAVAARIDIIQQRANVLVASGSSTVTIQGNAWWVADTRVGLSSDDRDGLRGTINYIGQLGTIAQQGKHAAQSFGRDGAVWDPFIADCQELLRRAGSVLDAE
jgi:hypothetical protein